MPRWLDLPLRLDTRLRYRIFRVRARWMDWLWRNDRISAEVYVRQSYSREVRHGIPSTRQGPQLGALAQCSAR